MHGPSFATNVPTAFVPPALNRAPANNSPAGTNLQIASPKLALSNPVGNPLGFQKPFSGRGLQDPRLVQHVPPRLVSLLAHGKDKDEALDQDGSGEVAKDPSKDAALALLNDALKAAEIGETESTASQEKVDENTDVELVPAGEVEGKGDGFKNPLPGVEIGVPLNILAAFFSSLRYGESVLGPDDMLLQACLGYLTYGTDRLLDAYTEKGEVSEKKQALYDDIKKNTLPMIAAITASTAHAFNTLNQRPETKPFIPLLASTFMYKQLKENFGSVKPFYIAAMWTAACVILPAVMHDHDFSILASPQDYLPAALLMFGSTNLADAKDIVEDTEKGIETLPVKLGKPMSDLVSYAALGTAALMIGSQLFGQ